MLKTLLLSLAVFFWTIATGQKRIAFELSFLSRYDRHANYITNYAGRSYNDTLRLSGISYGGNVQMRKMVSSSLSISLGVGYYSLRVNKIKGSGLFGIPITKRVRSINNEDDDSTRFGYSTPKYHYNNAAFTIGINKLVLLKNGIKLDVGAEGVGYYSFSQGYKLGNGYHYSTKNVKPMEVGINATIGLLKEYDKFYIRPALLLPFYQNLKGDRVFYEDRNLNISKWFNGIGVSFRIGKYL